MKNKILYIIVLASIALLGACNLNEYPVFDDNDAFVAFDENRLLAEETKGVLKIPVRLTSLNEINTTVTYELIDSTAISGRDYELSGGASVLDFDGSDPVQYIEIDILPHEGVFTGDLVFGVTLNNAGNVNLGGNDTIYVTILDLDHPLSAILGSYTALGTSYFDGTQSWQVTLEKDPAGDVNKVWITNLVAGGSSASTPLYGLVNEDMTELKIPVGQTVAVSTSYPSILFEGFYGPDGETNIPDGGSVTGLIEEGEISIQDEFGSHVYDDSSASAGWYNIFQADVVLTKK
ncbi:MAG: Calx-beta domain-containing protein [Dysgonamonadaceae bacterium]|nr:Calx-beta domain-containing protein [Dysgonamonadaceae bacterium]MDD3901985.1 Calx-beta domain-containing protein [Dysgonamonadaceae bacterium]MDD4400047.1 Calx-beta domain-containing protein [Dysgonamonadaceae bacterium]